MPSPNSFRTAVRQQFKGAPLASSLQIEILDNQCEILRRHLNDFTLKTLGSLACLSNGTGGCHGISEDSPLIGPDSRWSLPTQGVFAGTPFAGRSLYSPEEKGKLLYPQADGVYKTFGLARSGEWLYIEIEFVGVGYATLGNTRYERAACVRVVESDLPTIVQKTGIGVYSIFHFLTLTTNEWVCARKGLYDIAVDIEKQMKAEFELFSLTH